MTPEQFKHKIYNSNVGNKIVYHTGVHGTLPYTVSQQAIHFYDSGIINITHKFIGEVKGRRVYELIAKKVKMQD